MTAIKSHNHVGAKNGHRPDVALAILSEKSAADDEAGGRERGRPAVRGAVIRDERTSASTRWGCSRTGPARSAVRQWRIRRESTLAFRMPEFDTPACIGVLRDFRW